MQAPMLVLKNNSKRESGRKVQLSNIKAAKTISDIVSVFFLMFFELSFCYVFAINILLNIK